MYIKSQSCHTIFEFLDNNNKFTAKYNPSKLCTNLSIFLNNAFEKDLCERHLRKCRRKFVKPKEISIRFGDFGPHPSGNNTV